VINEFLPAKQVLHRRHIEPLATCDICGCQEASLQHVLLECTVAIESSGKNKATNRCESADPTPEDMGKKPDVCGHSKREGHYHL
jgi:hypothetical protein